MARTCRRCRAPEVVIDLPRHNASFCKDCFLHHTRQQVERTIDHFGMFRRDERILVAVSGGKDSLALWDLLLDLGYEADGLYLGLGIGEYSSESGDLTRKFAADRGASLIEVDLPNEFGFDIPTAADVTRRVPCSACGLSKRHLFNAVARERGYDVIATGHNLDDEAAVLFGNVLRWDTDYLGRQLPVLPASDGFARKVKPLVRLGEREMAAYCVLKGIDYIVEECPNAVGNKHLGYKEALNDIEAQSPGSKAAFYLGFIEKASRLFTADTAAAKDELRSCTECGSPTTGDVCAFCKLKRRVTAADDAPLLRDGGKTS